MKDVAGNVDEAFKKMNKTINNQMKTVTTGVYQVVTQSLSQKKQLVLI